MNNNYNYSYQNMSDDIYSTTYPQHITICDSTLPTTAATISPTNTKFNTDVEINGNLKINGTDLNQLLESIQSRLNILIPDPEKLEQYESLKKAYAHYKMLEALCEKK